MTHAAILKRIQSDAADVGFRKETGADHRTIYWCIRCYLCKIEFRTRQWGPSTTADQMLREMRRKGWEVGYGKKPICTCRNRRSAMPGDASTRPLTGITPAPAFNVTPPATPPTISHVGNPKIARAVFAALEDHFDVGKRLYRGSYTDEMIAKETGAALDYVMRMRKEAYGELAEDPVVTKLREDMERLKAKVRDEFSTLYDEVIALEARLPAKRA